MNIIKKLLSLLFRPKQDLSSETRRTLKDILTHSGNDRGLRLSRQDARQAFKEMGSESALRWLAKHLVSPVGPYWGNEAYRLRPDWKQLKFWMDQSKEHCLVAYDVLLQYARRAQLPVGANADVIHYAIDGSLQRFSNPRLEEAAKQIRYAWPLKPRTRHEVEIPAALLKSASILLLGNKQLVKDWQESMATALNSPIGSLEIWGELLQFCQGSETIAYFDSREHPLEIVAQLSNLEQSGQLDIDWRELTSFGGTADEFLPLVVRSLTNQSVELMLLDEGSDAMAVSILQQSDAAHLRDLAKSLNNRGISATIVPTSE